MLASMNIAQHRIDLSDRSLAMVWIGVALVSVIASAAAPIVAFIVMISAFGLPHVIYELRYCDERFSARAPVRLLGVLGALVGTIALLRIANGAHWITGPMFVPIELGLGAALALVAAYAMKERRLLGALVGLAFAFGATFYPIETFVAWAWLHNLTPLGFVAEITQGQERRRWLLLLSIPFFILPALVATGAFRELALFALGMPDLQTASVFGAGETPLLSFLPPGSSNLNLFSAAVVAQSMHYVAVIVLLPRLLQAKQGVMVSPTLVPWPGWRVFGFGVAFIAVLAFGLYSISYTDARAAYGVAAAIHAWLELPVLLLALGQGFRSERI